MTEFTDLPPLGPDPSVDTVHGPGFVTNIHAPRNDGGKPNAFHTNRYRVFMRLHQRGVVRIAEDEAVFRDGRSVDHGLAVYVNPKIGSEKAKSLTDTYEPESWLAQHEPNFNKLADEQELLSQEEIDKLVDRGIEETGLGDLLAERDGENANVGTSAEEPSILDANEVMRVMRDQLGKPLK